MKKVLNLLVAVVLVSFLASCGGNTEKKDGKDTTKEVTEAKVEVKDASKILVGTWKIGDFVTSEEIPAEQKAMWESILQTMKDSSSFVFSADGKLVTNTMGKVTNSTWRVDGTTLFVTDEGKPEVKSNLDEVSENKIVFSDTDEKGVKTTITLVK